MKRSGGIIFLSTEARKGKQTTYRVESRRHGGLRDKGGNSRRKTRVQMRSKIKRTKSEWQAPVTEDTYEARVGDRGS
jgi:hypothetical protein